MKFGIDRLRELPQLQRRLRGAKLGVLAHAASVDAELCHLLDRLAELDVKVQTLFGPEHGFGGAAQDMIGVADARHASGARIVSLYGDSLEDLVPKREDLADLDLLLIDLVDVGARYYTFVWTALLAVRAAAAAGVECIVLDRLNPLGRSVEGALQRDGYTSFVGWERVPIRHGLTLGEMVALFAARDGRGDALTVVTVAGPAGDSGWERAEEPPSIDRWQRGFVLPSPNMPTAETMAVYPGGCLLEGTNLSEGRGHTRPFEVFGAPWLDGERWARELMALGLAGFVARPLTFIPTFHKHAKEVCGGMQIHVTDARRFRPVACYAAAIALAWAQDPDKCRFRTERYEYVDDIPAFDLLTGSPAAREAISDARPAREVAELVSSVDVARWNDERAEAAAAMRACRHREP